MTVVAASSPQADLSWGQKVFLVFLRLLASVPWLWLVGFMILLVNATIQHGDLPFYGNPDPKEIVGWSVLVEPVLALFIVCLAAPLLLFMVVLVARSYLPAKSYQRPLPYFLLGESIFLFLPLVRIIEQLQEGQTAGVWLLLLTTVPFLGLAIVAAWDDILTFRWTRWVTAAVLWGFAYGALAPLALQLSEWLID